jgi:small-conductance mechanosensitive channel
MPNTMSFLLMKDNILILLAFLVIGAKLAGLLFFTARHHKKGPMELHVLLAKQPWIFATLILASIIAAALLTNTALLPSDSQLYLLSINILDILRSIASVGLFLGEARAIYSWLSSITPNRPILEALLPYSKNSLYLLAMILALPFLVPDFLKNPSLDFIINKMSIVLGIWVLAWLVMQLIVALEKTTLDRFHQNLSNDFRARRIYTQARVFKRIAMFIVSILAIAMTLMAFDSIREVGMSILASAGLATVVLGFAAQKTLGNLFAGIQIAITQPIRINDTVTLENELGTVEEISLTYVVVRIWDLRRLIVPINYFLEKPFQNLTRTSTNLLCPILFFADYSLPIDTIRKKFMEILKASKFWDQQVATLQVTDVQENMIKVRALASAKDSASSWNLRCEILEKLIAFINQHYPQSLPRIRNVNTNLSAS